MKKILLVGGTGAMGTYLVPEMRALGYAVDVVALDTRESGDPLVRYFIANCYDEAVVMEFLKNDYDAVVDFMVYHIPIIIFTDRLGRTIINAQVVSNS